MKKSIVAISTIAVLGLGYLGATWYTGKLLEENIDAKLASITQNITRVAANTEQLAGLTIKAVQYERGFFSSNVKLLIAINNTQYLYDTITVQHGPFSLTQFSHGSFLPKLATFTYQETATNTNNKQEGDTQVVQIIQNLSWGSAFGSIGYDGSITINDLDLKYDGRVVPATMDINRSAYFITIKNGIFMQSGNNNTTLKCDSLEFNDGTKSLLTKNSYFSFTDASVPLQSSNSTNNNDKTLAFKSEQILITERRDKTRIDNIDLMLDLTNQNDQINYNGKLGLSQLEYSLAPSLFSSNQKFTINDLNIAGKFTSDNAFMSEILMAKKQFAQLFEYPYQSQNSLYVIYSDLVNHYLSNDNAQLELTSSLNKFAYDASEDQNYFILQALGINITPKKSQSQQSNVDLVNIDAQINGTELKLDGYHQTMIHAINEQGLYHGDFTANLNQLSFVDEDDIKSLIEKMTFHNQETLIDKQYLSGETSFSVQKTLLSDIDWGNGEIDIHFKNFPMDSWINLVLFGDNHNQTTSNAESATKYPFGVSLEKFVWNTPKGSLTADANLAFNHSFESIMNQLDHAQLDLNSPDNSDNQPLTATLDAFHYNANLSLDGLTYLVLISNDADNDDLADAALFSDTKDHLRLFFNEFSQNTLPIELDATTLKGSLSYSKTEPTGAINGEKTANDKLLSLLNQLVTAL